MIQNLTSLNRCFSLHLTSMIFCRGEYIKSVRVAFAVAGSHAMQDNELLLLVICLLPCVLTISNCNNIVVMMQQASAAWPYLSSDKMQMSTVCSIRFTPSVVLM